LATSLSTRTHLSCSPKNSTVARHASARALLVAAGVPPWSKVTLRVGRWRRKRQRQPYRLALLDPVPHLAGYHVLQVWQRLVACGPGGGRAVQDVQELTEAEVDPWRHDAAADHAHYGSHAFVVRADQQRGLAAAGRAGHAKPVTDPGLGREQVQPARKVLDRDIDQARGQSWQAEVSQRENSESLRCEHLGITLMQATLGPAKQQHARRGAVPAWRRQNADKTTVADRLYRHLHHHGLPEARRC
jgi:hypothetical protein